MKTKVKSFVKAVIVILGAAAGFYGLFRLADTLAKRRLGDWFEGKFLRVIWHYYPNNYKESFFRWDVFKTYVLVGGMALAALFALAIVLTAAICKKQNERKLAEQAREFSLAMEQKERALQAQADQKNDLISYLAHDLKTPMTSVIGYLSLLEEAPEMPDSQKEKCVHIALDKAFRLEGLINEFFEITRYNLHEVVLNKRPIDLGYMLSQMADEFYPVLQKNGNCIRLEAPEGLTVSVDANKLARVFNNILKNAVAYSDPGTPIEITAQSRGEAVRIQVTNHGLTIPRHKLSSIFEKFYRLDEARGTNLGGAGLGLAIAKEIVTAHGGTIQAESEDGLTTFTVELPQ